MTLGDLARSGVLEFSDGYRTRRDQHASEGFRILRAGDVRDGRIYPDGPDFVAHTFAPAIGAKAARVGDVVLTTKGTVGRTGMVGSLDGDVVYSPQICYFRVRSADTVDPRFLLHWMSSPEFVDQAGYLKSSTDMAPYISLKDLGSTQISLPSPATQRAIAEVLGALDDKIAANQGVEAGADQLTLEAFRRVASLHDAFPQPLSEVASIVLGGTPSRARPEYWDGGDVAWLASGEANRSRVLEPTAWITSEALNSSSAKMMPRTASVLAITGATLGQIARLELTASGNQSLVGIWAEDPYLNDWVYFSLLESVDVLVRHATGAAQQHINKQVVERHEIAIPDQGVLERFGAWARPILDLAASTARESLRLAELRDTLLPHLMSGRLSVRQAEAQVEAVL